MNIYRHSCSVGSLIAIIPANPVQDVDPEMFLLQFGNINPLVGLIPRRVGNPTKPFPILKPRAFVARF